MLTAHAQLEQSLNHQQAALQQAMRVSPALNNTLHQSLRQIQAMRSLGPPGIDQVHELYTTIWEHLHKKSPVDWDTTTFHEGHALVENSRHTYNTAAYAYNNCQRHWFTGWLSEKMGHFMAPPC